MSTAQTEGRNVGPMAEKVQNAESLTPTYKANGPPTSGNWNQRDEEDDGSQYFMSEPSISEEGSENPAMRGLALLSPQDSLSGTMSAGGSPNRQQLEEPLMRIPSPPMNSGLFMPMSPPRSDTPNSPGGNTSLSSRDSPFWPRKYQFMAYPPGESDHSVEGQRSRLKIDTSVVLPRLSSNGSTPQPSSNLDTETDKSSDNHLDYTETTTRQAPHDASSNPIDANFLRNVKLESDGATGGEAKANIESVMRPRELADDDKKESEKKPETENLPEGVIPDETLLLTLSASFEEEQDGFAEDKKNAERPRRKKGNHRRTRSGDDVAAMIMTGGTEWRGMEVDNFPAPPLFGVYDDDDDETEESLVHANRSSERVKPIPERTRKGLTPAELAMKASAGYAAGPYGVSPRRAQNQQPARRYSSGLDHWSLSDSTLSPGLGFDGENSLSSLPSYVERRPSYKSSGSLSTLELTGAESKVNPRRRSASEKSKKASSHKKDDVGKSGSDSGGANDSTKRRRSLGSTSENSSAESRASSKFSWLSNSVHALPADGRIPANAPPPPYPTSTTPSHGRLLRRMEDPSESGSSSYSSETDSSEDEGPLSVHQNMLQSGAGQSIRIGPPSFHAQGQRVLRPRNPPRANIGNSPFANIGKSTRTFLNKQSYAPTTRADDTDKYPTFVCPRCGTRQREFFSISNAPTQDSAAGYLAFYFFIYVVASLYIFGLQEGWNALDCVYFAVITLTTAGLGDFVPTSDGAKVICSIFIYFGVACIGLLLGSYLAGSLDEASQKEAQANRIESCLTCNRLRAMKAAAKAKRRANVRSERIHSGSESSAISAAKMFMSEAPERHNFENHQAVYERAEKRHKHLNANTIEKPAPYSRGSSDPVRSSGPPANLDSHRSMGAVQREAENQSVESQNSSDGNIRSGQSSLGVIDEFNGRHEIPFASPPTPGQAVTPASPGAALGSPVTANILIRQQHTRHASLDIGNADFFENDPFGKRQRLFSDEVGRHQISPTIPEGRPAPPSQFSLEQTQDDSESEIEEDSSDESSTSDSSEQSVLGVSDSKTPTSRLKTAKYVFLTLKQAVVNSMFIIALGSVGFYLIEKMTAIDSFYFTTVLLTTVGYGDIVPVTAPGKLFATVYLLVAGTVLLHNMSTISMIPLELRKRRIERAVLTQFGDQLDDFSLRELATGPLVRRLQLSAKSQSGLDECTREMFALAMLVRLGKVTEHDIRMTFAAFRRLDVGNDGVLDSQDIIVGMMQKRRQTSINGLDAYGREAERAEQQGSDRPWYFFGHHGSMHELDDDSHFGVEEQVTDPEHEALLHSQMAGMDNMMYNSTMNRAHCRFPSYDAGYSGSGRSFGPMDVESGYSYTRRRMSHDELRSGGSY